MALKEPQKEYPMSAEFAALGKERIDKFVKFQSELVDTLQESNRQWFERAQSEASLNSELASKLMAVRSIPEATAVCQEWTTRRFELMAEDGKRVLAEAQKLMETGARLWSNGAQIKGGGPIT